MSFKTTKNPLVRQSGGVKSAQSWKGVAVEDKETLVSELAKKLRAAEDFLTETEDCQRLPPESLSGYRRNLIALQCKHIPAEICSVGKLIERIEEVDSLVGDLKGELERQ